MGRQSKDKRIHKYIIDLKAKSLLLANVIGGLKVKNEINIWLPSWRWIGFKSLSLEEICWTTWIQQRKIELLPSSSVPKIENMLLKRVIWFLWRKKKKKCFQVQLKNLDIAKLSKISNSDEKTCLKKITWFFCLLPWRAWWGNETLYLIEEFNSLIKSQKPMINSDLTFSKIKEIYRLLSVE